MRLDLEKLNTMEVVEWKPKNMTATICEAKGKNAVSCDFYEHRPSVKQFVVENKNIIIIETESCLK